MASATERLASARRGIIKRQKRTDMLSGMFGTLGTISAFAGGQIKKAKTAWEEYEAGYKALGGTGPIDKGGWFSRTFIGPKGEIGIDKKIYDVGKVRKAGAFLGSDAAIALFAGDKEGGIKKSYLQRTAPGRDMTPKEIEMSKLSGSVIPKVEALIKKNPYKSLLETYEEGLYK